MAGDAQHQPADRIGRSPAVVEHVVPRLIALDRDVLPERAQQIGEEGHRQLVRAHRVGHRDEDQSFIESDGVDPAAALEQPLLPVVEQPQAFGVAVSGLVGEVVGAPRKA